MFEYEHRNDEDWLLVIEPYFPNHLCALTERFVIVSVTRPRPVVTVGENLSKKKKIKQCKINIMV